MPEASRDTSPRTFGKEYMRDHDDPLISELSAHYGRLLQAGFIILRQAVASSDLDWIQAEIEFLHNIPSLIGESNMLRHEYFWNKELIAYIDWASVAWTRTSEFKIEDLLSTNLG